uniref:Uncharacterized protein n=1 Tax=Sphaerodactylus townsendi TaxID=933632 RepID=A0ACB8FY69_9SAUR
MLRDMTSGHSELPGCTSLKLLLLGYEHSKYNDVVVVPSFTGSFGGKAGWQEPYALCTVKVRQCKNTEGPIKSVQQPSCRFYPISSCTVPDSDQDHDMHR